MSDKKGTYFEIEQLERLIEEQEEKALNTISA